MNDCWWLIIGLGALYVAGLLIPIRGILLPAYLDYRRVMDDIRRNR